MPPLRQIPYREVRRRLLVAGFAEVSQKGSQKGSHVKFAKQTPEGLRAAIVPKHSEITIGTLHSILNQAGITPQDFLRL